MPYGIVVTVPGYRSRGPGSIPGATRFSEKQWVCNGVYPASLAQLRSYMKGKVAASIWKTYNTAIGVRQAEHMAPSIRKVVTNFGGRSVDIVRSRTQATELVQFSYYSILSAAGSIPVLKSAVLSLSLSLSLCAA
jgi:hypothetical protein